MRLVVVAGRVLGPVDGGHDDVADGDHDVQAPAELRVPEEAHHLVEQAHLAAQPVHRRVAELLVDRVEVEEDRGARPQDLGEDVLEVVPCRVLDVGGELAGVVAAVDDRAQLRVDRPGPAELAQQVAVVVAHRLRLLEGEVGPELLVGEQVRGQRAQDRPVPHPHPFLGEKPFREPRAGLDDRLGRRGILLGVDGVDRLLVRLEGAETSQVDGLSRAEPSDDHAGRRVVGRRRERPERRVAVEVDEVAQDVLDRCSGTVRVAERACPVRQPVQDQVALEFSGHATSGRRNRRAVRTASREAGTGPGRCATPRAA